MRWLIFLILTGLPVMSQAVDFKQLEALTAAPDSLRGQFTQTKFVQALDAEFQSSGRFEYQRNRSISWHTLKRLICTSNDKFISP